MTVIFLMSLTSLLYRNNKRTETKNVIDMCQELGIPLMVFNFVNSFSGSSICPFGFCRMMFVCLKAFECQLAIKVCKQKL